MDWRRDTHEFVRQAGFSGVARVNTCYESLSWLLRRPDDEMWAEVRRSLRH